VFLDFFIGHLLTNTLKKVFGDKSIHLVKSTQALLCSDTNDYGTVEHLGLHKPNSGAVPIVYEFICIGVHKVCGRMGVKWYFVVIVSVGL
jgi:hypothetical protein